MASGSPKHHLACVGRYLACNPLDPVLAAMLNLEIGGVTHRRAQRDRGHDPSRPVLKSPSLSHRLSGSEGCASHKRTVPESLSPGYDF